MPDRSSGLLDVFEAAVDDLLAAFDVERPPIPVELILQRPRPGMWREVNLGDLSLSFITVTDLFSPRMAVARLLARYMCGSPWGEAHGLRRYADNDDEVRALARAVIMPRGMIVALGVEQRTPLDIGARFEVPEADARQRLLDLGYLQSG
jgi:hypothetical protein